MISRRFLAVGVLIGVSGGMLLAQSTNPLVGTWKLNVAKSKSPFKSGSTTIEAVGEGIKFMVDLAGTDGVKSHWEFTGKLRRQGRPRHRGEPVWRHRGADARGRKYHRIADSYQGKPTTTHMIAVSPDGKTRTSSAKGTDKAGKPIDAMSFYEKQ